MKPQHHIVDRIDLALMSIAVLDGRPLEIRLSAEDERALLRHYEVGPNGATLSRPLKYKDVPVVGDIGDSHIVARNAAGTASERVPI